MFPYLDSNYFHYPWFTIELNSSFRSFYSGEKLKILHLSVTVKTGHNTYVSDARARENSTDL